MLNYTLITGASSGIGRGISLKLSSFGENIILHGNNKSKLKEVDTLCENNANIIWENDFEKVELLSDDLIKLIQMNSIKISTVIHCAGYSFISKLKKTPLSIIEKMYKINFFSISEVLRVLLKKKYNSKCLEKVIVLSSVASKNGEAGNAVYSSSKAALNSLVRTLAVENNDRIRINAILPGLIDTPMSADFIKKIGKKELEKKYLLRLGKIDDIVNCVEYLLSSESKWITGQELVIDGGRSIN